MGHPVPRETLTAGGPISERRASLNRIVATIVSVALTSAIGGFGVVLCYYPIRHAHFAFQWLLVFFLMCGESMAVHLPSEVILPVGGWLVVREHDLGFLGVLGLSVVAASGNTIGALVLYEAGRRGDRPLVRRFGRYFLVNESSIDAAAVRFDRHTVRAVLMSRLLPVVRTYASFVAGMLTVPLRAFVVATFAGSFIWCVAFVTAGALLG